MGGGERRGGGGGRGRRASTRHTPPPPPPPLPQVGYAAALFYGYVGAGGVAVWAALRWALASPLPLVSVWTIYGYALTPFLPAAPLCALPHEGVRWGVIVGAAAVSGAFLAGALRGPVCGGGAARAAPVAAAMAAAHAGVAVALKLSIFHYWK